MTLFSNNICQMRNLLTISNLHRPTNSGLRIFRKNLVVLRRYTYTEVAVCQDYFNHRDTNKFNISIYEIFAAISRTFQCRQKILLRRLHQGCISTDCTCDMKKESVKSYGKHGKLCYIHNGSTQKLIPDASSRPQLYGCCNQPDNSTLKSDLYPIHNIYEKIVELPPYTECSLSKSSMKGSICVNCNQFFTSKIELEKHEKTTKSLQNLPNLQVHSGLFKKWPTMRKLFIFNTCKKYTTFTGVEKHLNSDKTEEDNKNSSLISLDFKRDKDIQQNCENNDLLQKSSGVELTEHQLEKPHKCDDHDKSVDESSKLKNPKQEKKYRCCVCKRRFVSYTGYKLHFLTTHMVDKPYQCDICSERFETSKFVKQHKHYYNHYTDLNDKENTNTDLLEASALNRVGNQNSVSIDDSDSQVKEDGGSSDDILLENDLGSLTVDEPYKCDVCIEVFSTISALIDHRTNYEHIFVCEYCSKPLNTYNNLMSHMEDEHKELYCACQVCGEKFDNIKLLTAHSKTHKIFQCVICYITFQNQKQLVKHYTYHEERYKCALCFKNFPDKPSLQSHMKSHKKNNRYPCSFCQEGFDSLSLLQEHVKVHSGEKPYSCPHCHEQFNYHWLYYEHVKNHAINNEISLTCPVCGNSFKNLRHLRRHMALGHTSKPIIKKKESVQDPEVRKTEKLVQCQVCNKNFYNEIYLKRHKWQEHGLTSRGTN